MKKIILILSIIISFNAQAIVEKKTLNKSVNNSNIYEQRIQANLVKDLERKVKNKTITLEDILKVYDDREAKKFIDQHELYDLIPKKINNEGL